MSSPEELKTRRVVFLDFDDVLNDDHTSDWIKPGPGLFHEGHTGLDTEKVELLNNLVTVFPNDLRFVFSTSWRKFYSDPELLEILRKRGFKGQLHERSPRTQVRFSYQARGDEITDWLDDAAGFDFLPESFVVLDDITTDYSKPEVDRQVETEPGTGLTMDGIVKATQILQRKCERREYLLNEESWEEA